ncbi:MAG: hypothetical protein WB795_01825 [Candidatus Acidiferrales bacterium]
MLIRTEVGLCFVEFAISKRNNRISGLAAATADGSEFNSNWIWHRAIRVHLGIWSSPDTLADGKVKKYPLEYGFYRDFSGES